MSDLHRVHDPGDFSFREDFSCLFAENSTSGEKSSRSCSIPFSDNSGVRVISGRQTRQRDDTRLTGGWADLCAGWSWHAVAGVNFDIGSLVNDLEKIIGAVTTIGKIIAIVA